MLHSIINFIKLLKLKLEKFQFKKRINLNNSLRNYM